MAAELATTSESKMLLRSTWSGFANEYPTGVPLLVEVDEDEVDDELDVDVEEEVVDEEDVEEEVVDDEDVEEEVVDELDAAPPWPPEPLE